MKTGLLPGDAVDRGAQAMTSDMVFLGLDWADVEEPGLRLAPASGGSSVLVQWDAPLSYRSAAPGFRRCCGYIDLSTAPLTHVPCDGSRRIPKGTQCSACRAAEGFVAAHHAHLGAALSPHVRAYLDQPHWLYLAVFADRSCKVGTVAASRQHARLAEQGAYAACFVARAADGIAVRRAEAAVAGHFGLRQAVPTSWKLRALQGSVDAGAATARLSELADAVTAFLGEFSAGDLAVTVLSESAPWHRPACATALFDLAPLTRFPHDLTTGAHTLFPVAASGSIMAVTGAVDGLNADLWAVNLAVLKGTVIEVAG